MLSAPVVGRLLDKLVFWVGLLVAIIIVLVSQAIMTAAAAINIGAIVVACISERSLPPPRLIHDDAFLSDGRWTSSTPTYITRQPWMLTIHSSRCNRSQPPRTSSREGFPSIHGTNLTPNLALTLP